MLRRFRRKSRGIRWKLQIAQKIKKKSRETEMGLDIVVKNTVTFILTKNKSNCKNNSFPDQQNTFTFHDVSFTFVFA